MIFRNGKQVLFLQKKNTPQFYDFKKKLKECCDNNNLEDFMKENKSKKETKFSKEERELLKIIDDKNFKALDGIEKAKIFSIQGFNNLLKESTGLTEEKAFQVIKNVLSSYKSRIFQGNDYSCYYSCPGGEPENIDKNILDVLKRECKEEIGVILEKMTYNHSKSFNQNSGKHLFFIFDIDKTTMKSVVETAEKKIQDKKSEFKKVELFDSVSFKNIETYYNKQVFLNHLWKNSEKIPKKVQNGSTNPYDMLYNE